MRPIPAYIDRVKKFLQEISNDEKVVLLAIFIHQFSLWPSVQFNSLGGFDIEPSMFAGLLVVGYVFWKYREDYFRKIVGSNSIWLLGWFGFALVIALLSTYQPAYIVFRFIHIFSVILAGLLIGQLYANKRISLSNIFYGWVLMALAMAPFFIYQYVLASFGVAEVVKPAYRVGVFQFPRLHGFSFEPLFLANWLLIPTIYSLYKSNERFFLVAGSVLSMYIFLSLGRGGIYAVVLAMGLLWLHRRTLTRALELTKPIVIGLLVSLLFVGLSSHFNRSTALSGIGRYLDHMTLGVFNVSGATNVSYRSVEITNPDGTTEIVEFIDGSELDTEGVVEGSTIGRLQAIRTGIDVFEANPVAGAGIFRLGEEARELFPEVYKGDNLVSNALPVDMLAEGGIIGIAILGAFAITARRLLFRFTVFAFVLVFALAIQSLFFSSYVVLPLWIAIGMALSSKQEKEFKLG